MERSQALLRVRTRQASHSTRRRPGGKVKLAPFSYIAPLSYTALALLWASGCASPYRADRGALFGGAAGAGVGALVGEAVGHPLAGALVGAGVGSVSGAAVGGSLDEIEAENRAMIAAQMGREIPRGAVTVGEVIDMTRQRLDDDLIVNHIRYNGVVQRPQSRDLIALQQNGVSKRVIEAMQAAQPPQPQPIAGVAPPPPPMVVPQPYYGPPVWGPYPYYYPPPPPAWGVGFSFR